MGVCSVTTAAVSFLRERERERERERGGVNRNGVFKHESDIEARSTSVDETTPATSYSTHVTNNGNAPALLPP